MKICHVCASSFTVKHMLGPLVEAALHKGWDVDLIFNMKSELDILTPLRARYISVPIERSANPLKNLKSFFCLLRVLRLNKYDIVHFHTPVASLWGRLATSLIRPSIVVYTSHGYYFHERMNPFFYRLHHALEKAMAYRTDVIFCQSAEDYQTSVESHFSPRGGGLLDWKWRIETKI